MARFRIRPDSSKLAGMLIVLSLVGATPLRAQSAAYPEICTAREQWAACVAAGLGVCPPVSAPPNTFPEPGTPAVNRPSSTTLPSSPGIRKAGALLGETRGDLGFVPSEQEKGLLRILADEAFPGISDDMRLLQEENFGSTQTWYVLGKTGSAVVVTGALAAEGGVSLLNTLSPALTQGPCLLAISQWAGPVGYGALGVYEGFTVWQWGSGWMTDRQFARHQAHFLGGVGLGVAGGWAGAKAGAVSGGLVGAFFGPAGIPVGATVGATVGLIGGGVAGGLVGSGLSRHGVNRWFEFKDQQQEAEYIRFLRSHYGLQ
jgi:hypothetical protein